MFFYSEQEAQVQAQTGATDPHFYSTSLLLKMDSDFSDSSINNHTVTANGDATISSTESKYGGASGEFDGSGDYLTVGTSADCDTGGVFAMSEQFTVEMWINFSNVNGEQQIIENYNGASGPGWTIFKAGDSRGIALYVAGVGSIDTGVQPQANTWHHLSFCRDGTNGYIFLDGNLIGSLASFGTSEYFQNQQPLHIARRNPADGRDFWANAYIDDVRITKGVARYTANFTPPTEAHPTTGPDPYFYNTSLLLKADSDFTDSSVNSHTVTTNGTTAAISTSEYKYGGGSAFLDRFDHLTIPTSEDLQFGTGDFTIECWTKLEQNASPYPAIYSNYNSWQAGALGIYAGNGTDKYTVALNPTHPVITSTTTIQYNDWVHVALTRESGVMRLFINGNLEGSHNSSATLNGVGPSTWIGTSGDVAANGGTTGYFDDFRITKGVARYTTNFALPGAHSSI